MNYEICSLYVPIDEGDTSRALAALADWEKCVRLRERIFFEAEGMKSRKVEKSKTSQCGPAERRHQNRVTKEEIIGGAWISRRETVGRRAERDRSYSIAGMTRSGGL